MTYHNSYYTQFHICARFKVHTHAWHFQLKLVPVIANTHVHTITYCTLWIQHGRWCCVWPINTEPERCTPEGHTPEVLYNPKMYALTHSNSSLQPPFRCVYCWCLTLRIKTDTHTLHLHTHTHINTLTSWSPPPIGGPIIKPVEITNSIKPCT